MRRSQGFTLIELVAVIVILGILAAVAVPKFFNLSNEAKQAALNSTVGSIESASTMNFAAYEASPSNAVLVNGNNNSSCDQAVRAVLNGQGSLSQHYTMGGGPLTAVTAGSVDKSCTITYTGTGYQSTINMIVTGG